MKSRALPIVFARPEPRISTERTLADAAMERYATGDDAAFAIVYDALAPRLFAYLLRHARPRARAEDLLQQTFLHLHRSRGTFVKESAVLPWALAIARRLLIDESRRAQRNVPEGGQELGALSSAEPDALDRLHAFELEARVHTQLAALPPLQRAAFELVRLEGLSHAQAAETLGVSVSSVKLRAHRAYVALRRALGGRAGTG